MPPLDDGEQRAWRCYLQLHRQLLARLNRQLQADSGLSLADYEVPVRLAEAPDGRLRPFELQRGLEWEQRRLSHQLRRMQHAASSAARGAPTTAAEPPSHSPIMADGSSTPPHPVTSTLSGGCSSTDSPETRSPCSASYPPRCSIGSTHQPKSLPERTPAPLYCTLRSSSWI
jgi:hypothetical protein